MPVRPERVRLQEPDLPEHVLEASMIVAGKAGAPPRPRTHVGQANPGSNPAVRALSVTSAPFLERRVCSGRTSRGQRLKRHDA